MIICTYICPVYIQTEKNEWKNTKWFICTNVYIVSKPEKLAAIAAAEKRAPRMCLDVPECALPCAWMCLTLPLPWRTSVPMNAKFSLWETPLLGESVSTAVILDTGSVSPVKLLSSTDMSTPWNRFVCHSYGLPEIDKHSWAATTPSEVYFTRSMNGIKFQDKCYDVLTSNSLRSAGTRSPTLRWTMSPGTRSRA